MRHQKLKENHELKNKNKADSFKKILDLIAIQVFDPTVDEIEAEKYNC